MFRSMPFNIRENAERGRELLEKAIEFMADQPCNPIGRVSGALSSFRVDVVDVGGRYEIFAELPGFRKDQITVSYNANCCLNIKAERPESELEAKYLCRERRTGDFERSFQIDDVVEKDVTVSYDNGILHIVLPKVPEEENRTVFDID